ncbi:transcription elongation factor GreA [Ruminococcus sp. Marseille-P6503]|uniref:transcription elongation factor GreA n=1 Tax=Ruminococcus sp. Marseille-P6503 TaxID=2364796 RepID=UPI000F53A5D0|nr:transcription elongation factor GreA [Ruminococcus sp. Marseille-P6503]
MANTISKAGYAKLEQDLEHLVTVRRSEVAEKLKEARSFGDLSENAEYDEAKNEQGILEARIAELENILANAVVVDDDDISITEIGVGSIIKLRDLELDEVETLQIVGSTESDPDNNKISDESPIGKAAINKKVGDIFEVEAPVGTIKFEVLEISK